MLSIPGNAEVIVKRYIELC